MALIKIYVIEQMSRFACHVHALLCVIEKFLNNDFCEAFLINGLKGGPYTVPSVTDCY